MKKGANMKNKWHDKNNYRNNFYYKKNKKHNNTNMLVNNQVNNTVEEITLNNNQINNKQNNYNNFNHYKKQNNRKKYQNNWYKQKNNYKHNYNSYSYNQAQNVDKDYLNIFNDIEESSENNNVTTSFFTRKPVVGYILGTFLLIALVFGVTYAYFAFIKIDSRQADIVAGEVYVRVSESNLPINLSLVNSYPRTKEEARTRTDNYVDFTVVGKNTSLENNVLYNFTLLNGSDISNKIRIAPENVKFDLATVDSSNNETIIIDSATMSEFNNINLDFVNYVANNTTAETNVKYRLRMWISDTVIISDTEENRTYTTEQFSNTYANVGLNISTELTGKSMPLIVLNNKANVSSGKSVIQTKISNFYELRDDNANLDTVDVIRYQITDPSNVVYFRYADSKNNEVIDDQESLDLTYNFTKNENITHQITLVSRNGENVNTKIRFKIYKNGQLLKEYSQLVNVIGENYCINNAFTKLADCILVSENNSSSVSLAKTQIIDKGSPDLTTTAPAYTDSEHTVVDLENSEKGLYEVDDDQGESFIFRGDVTNNNVTFAGLSWKIIRINGDGSIRLIYNDGNSHDIAWNVKYNEPYLGPTYSGYMYNEESSPWESATVSKNDFDNTKSYYWADGYTSSVDENGITRFTLSTVTNPMVAMTFADMKTDYDTNGNSSQLLKTPYTCLMENSNDTCTAIYNVLSITDTTTADVKYITVSPNSTDKSVVDANIKSSGARRYIENWYQNTFLNLNNNGKPVSNYIVDNVWCNDRTITGSTNGYLLTSEVMYLARARLDDNDTSVVDKATLKCTNTNDRFSYTVSNGNGKLSYPVGLITADEVVLAGGRYMEKNPNFYLNSGGNYWTMTPAAFSERTSNTAVFFVSSNGVTDLWRTDTNTGIRPVINLSRDVMITSGDGSTSNPYMIK